MPVHQHPRQLRDIPRGHVVLRGVDARGVDVVRPAEAEFLRPLVHSRDEGVLVFGAQPHKALHTVAAARHGDARHKLAHGVDLPHAYPVLGAGRPRLLRHDGECVLPVQRAALHVVEHQQQRHQLRQARGRARLVALLLIEVTPAAHIQHGDGAGGQIGKLQRRGTEGEPREHAQGDQRGSGKRNNAAPFSSFFHVARAHHTRISS